MKILQVSNKVPFPANDGGAIGVISFTKALIDLGHEVTFITLNTPKHYFHPNQIPEPFKSKVKFITVDIANDLSPLKAVRCLLQNKSYNIERFVSEDFKNALIKLLSSESFDIIQLEGLYLSYYLETIRNFAPNAKVGYRSHNVEFIIWDRITKNETNPIKKAYLHILTRQLKKYETSRLHLYDCVTPVTEIDLLQLKPYRKGKPMKVIPAGFDFSQLNTYTENEPEPNSLFFLGALDWIPNEEGVNWFLKNVWPLIHARFPQLTFYIAGRNTPEYFFQLNLPNVVVLGEVANAYEYISTKQIMLVPLLSGSGIRIKIIEGLAMGKAIISTHIGAEGIEVENRKNILLADSPEEFVNQIAWLLEDKKRIHDIEKQASSFAHKHYNILHITQELVEFYQNTPC